MNRVGIVVLATNAYFVLGIRFIKKFTEFYKGDSHIRFYFFSDENPYDYLPDNIDVKYFHEIHSSWVDGTNSKFTNMVKLEYENIDYLYYFDADTNFDKNFDDFFLGDIVGSEHYGNTGWMKDNKAFDRNPLSKAYIPIDTPLPQMYYHGCLFGGNLSNVMDMCWKLISNQFEDKKINYEPAVNDESYINQYFHYNPPYVILFEDLKFVISDKGGIGDTRNSSLDVHELKNEIKALKNVNFDIKDSKIIKPTS